MNIFHLSSAADIAPKYGVETSVLSVSEFRALISTQLVTWLENDFASKQNSVFKLLKSTAQLLLFGTQIFTDVVVGVCRLVNRSRNYHPPRKNLNNISYEKLSVSIYQ
jgi:hypothetical protein